MRRLLPFAPLLAACAGPLATVELPERPPAAVLVSSAAVFDGERLLGPRDVLFRDGRVARIAPAGSLEAPDALRFDGRGRTLLPGLVDMHVHLMSPGGHIQERPLPAPERHAKAYLYAGVTRLLVAQSWPPEHKLARRAARGGEALPRMDVAGPGLTAPGGHPMPLFRAVLPWFAEPFVLPFYPTASTPEEAREEAEEVADELSPPFYKLFYDSLPPGAPKLTLDALAAAIEAARDRGMRPVVHVGSAADLVEAAEAGAELLMHTAYEDRLSEEQLARLKELGVPAVTTVRVWTAASETGRLPIDRELAPPALLAGLKRALKDPPEEFRPVLESSGSWARLARENVAALHRAGVPLFAGTDAGVPGVLPGAGLHAELLALAELGLTPVEALRSATSAPGDFLGGSGRLAEGVRADALLVRGDPTTDLRALMDIEAVFLAGSPLVRRPAPGAPGN